MKPINDTIRFLVEVASVILLIVAGLAFGNLPAKIIFAGVVPLVLVAIWSIFMAPKSDKRLPEVQRLLIEILFFGYTAVMTWFMISKPVAIIYLVVAVINTYFDHKL
ncbi:YrdB family protein [Leuconostocaceae bacterium ESL0723]|nr:YrdB family protein [Leuconostocaceae bacterium ESL0723]